MRRLKGAIPRGFADHRSTVAKRYRVYCEAIQAQYGPLPAIALPALKEAGRAFVELDRLAADLERARQRRRVRDARAIRKQQFMLREQLARLEVRLEAWAGKRRPADPLAGVAAAVAAANRRSA